MLLYSYLRKYLLSLTTCLCVASVYFFNKNGLLSILYIVRVCVLLPNLKNDRFNVELAFTTRGAGELRRRQNGARLRRMIDLFEDGNGDWVQELHRTLVDESLQEHPVHRSQSVHSQTFFEMNHTSNASKCSKYPI